MNDKGFHAFIEQTVLQRGEPGYRVRIGPYTELVDRAGNRP